MQQDFTIDEAAAVLGVDRPRVYQIISDGFVNTEQSERGTVIPAAQVGRYHKYQRMSRNEQKKERKKILKGDK